MSQKSYKIIFKPKNEPNRILHTGVFASSMNEAKQKIKAMCVNQYGEIIIISCTSS